MPDKKIVRYFNLLKNENTNKQNNYVITNKKIDVGVL